MDTENEIFPKNQNFESLLRQGKDNDILESVQKILNGIGFSITHSDTSELMYSFKENKPTFNIPDSSDPVDLLTEYDKALLVIEAKKSKSDPKEQLDYIKENLNKTLSRTFDYLKAQNDSKNLSKPTSEVYVKKTSDLINIINQLKNPDHQNDIAIKLFNQ